MESTEDLKQLVESQQETINSLLERLTIVESKGVAPNLMRIVHPENLELNLTDDGCCKPRQASAEEPTE